MLGYRGDGVGSFHTYQITLIYRNKCNYSYYGDELRANSNRVALEGVKSNETIRNYLLSAKLITSCLPNSQGEQRITVQGLLRIQPLTPKLVNGKTYWITKVEVSVRTALGNSTRAMGTTDLRIATLQGKIIGVTGIIELCKGKPQIEVTSGDQIKGLNFQLAG